MLKQKTLFGSGQTESAAIRHLADPHIALSGRGDDIEPCLRLEPCLQAVRSGEFSQQFVRVGKDEFAATE